MNTRKPERSRASTSGFVQPIAALPLEIAEKKELRRLLAYPMELKGRASDLLNRFLLAEVVNSVQSSLSLDEFLHRLVTLSAATLNAERGTIFLYDTEHYELFAQVAEAEKIEEIRIPRSTGIAGAVFDSVQPVIVHDPYSDPRFNANVDQRTGFRTRSLICVPLRDQGGRTIGVIEVLNKRENQFDQIDLVLLQAIADQAATALAHSHAFDEQRRERLQDQKLFEMTEAISVELDLDRLLAKIVETAAELMNAERSTLFVHDPATSELWSRVMVGGSVDEIRFSSTIGVAGACFTTVQAISVPNAYSDPRFNPSVDARTGFQTRSLLCVPIVDQRGVATGVLEVLNKRTGRFTGADERRQRAFGTQIAIALQNAQLFTDVLVLKNYADSILKALSDGVVTLDRDFNVVGMNEAARKILRVPQGHMIEGSAESLWGRTNSWLLESLAYVAHSGGRDQRTDVAFNLKDGRIADVNVTVNAVRTAAGALTGVTLVLHDITREKQVHATISRYMAKEFAERVFTSGYEPTADSVQVATVLFSDIRRFTTMTEALTPQATVKMLNEYFGEMAEVVEHYGGALDKYIGDAVMAVFGGTVPGAADADNAVTAAIEMIRQLRQLNLQRVGRGAQPLEISIGLATGEIASGSVGSPNRMDYTVIGDSVNLAARLQGANQHYGTTILLAGATVERLASTFRLRRIDLVRVKGKETATEIFEVLDHHTEQSLARFKDAVPLFEDGIRLYRARDWSRAATQFSEVLKIFPNDSPSWVYTDRCLYYRDHPPDGAWDGVWNMQTK